MGWTLGFSLSGLLKLSVLLLRAIAHSSGLSVSVSCYRDWGHCGLSFRVPYTTQAVV